MGEHIAAFYERPSLHTEIYDTFAAERIGRDIGFWVELAVDSGGPLLEVACGTGRVSWAMADAGVEVVGVDRSVAMLERARAKAGEHPQARASFREGDMRDFDLGRTFPLVVVPFRAFQALLSVADQLAALDAFRRHLDPGGRLVLALFDPRLEALLDRDRVEDMAFIHPERGTNVRIRARKTGLDLVAQTMSMLWEFTEIDEAGEALRRDVERLDLRWSYRYETMHLLGRAGFEVEAEFGDYDRSPPTYGREQIWIARRLA